MQVHQLLSSLSPFPKKQLEAAGLTASLFPRSPRSLASHGICSALVSPLIPNLQGARASDRGKIPGPSVTANLCHPARVQGAGKGLLGSEPPPGACVHHHCSVSWCCARTRAGGDARCRFLGCQPGTQPLCSTWQWVVGVGWDGPALLSAVGITQKGLVSLGKGGVQKPSELSNICSGAELATASRFRCQRASCLQALPPPASLGGRDPSGDRISPRSALLPSWRRKMQEGFC